MWKEIEFKYSANDISLSKFKKVMKQVAIATRPIEVSGRDIFFSSIKSPDTFLRIRQGANINQLTFKRKLTSKNNYIRTEYNINLSPRTVSTEVAALCNEMGYEFNFSIIKKATIFDSYRHSVVYYSCYTEDNKLLGSYIEIEMSESYLWASENEAMLALKAEEKRLKRLGISPRKRIKKSLFELFKDKVA